MARGPVRNARKKVAVDVKTSDEEPMEVDVPRTNGVHAPKTTKKRGGPAVNDDPHAPKTTKKRGRPAGKEGHAKKILVDLIDETIRKRFERLKSEGGSVLCLGQGDTGQLGLGEDILERAKPALVKEIDEKVVGVEAGGMHTVCVTESGKVLTFGCNDEGALGRAIDEDEEGFSPAEVKLPEGTNVVQVTAGDSHCTALGEDGKAFYWGTFRDSSGSFGLTPDGKIQKLPVPLAHHLTVRKISSGADHVALLTDQGEIYTLGCAEQGQLGRVGERFTSRGGRRGLDLILKPDQVHAKNRRTVFVDVWAGSYNTLCLTDGGEVYACGLNNYNQLGISNGMVFHTLVKSSGFSDGKWSKVSFGQHHALGLDEDGNVSAIGRVEYGRLGLGTADSDGGKADAKVPTRVNLEGKKCVEVTCGTAVSFAVTESGDCYSWGMGTNGQLGHAEGDEDAWVPTKMVGKQLETRKVIGVSGGGQHTVVLAKDK